MAKEDTKSKQEKTVEASPSTVPGAHFGRPTEYDPIRTIERANAYIESPRAANGKVGFPSVARLALYLGVHRSTIYEWAKTYPDFSDIVEKLLAEQESTLIENGLDGTFNSSITKVILTKHGYKDATDLTTNNKDIVPENQSAANAAIANFLTKKNGKPDNTGNTPK